MYSRPWAKSSIELDFYLYIVFEFFKKIEQKWSTEYNELNVLLQNKNGVFNYYNTLASWRTITTIPVKF